MNDYISNISSIQSTSLRGEVIAIIIKNNKDEFTLEIEELKNADVL